MVLQTNISLPSNGIRKQISNTKAFIGTTDYGVGTLCVAERFILKIIKNYIDKLLQMFYIFSNLIWRQENGNGLCFDYPHIALHAVSTDLTSFPHECLYVMLDTNILSNFMYNKDIGRGIKFYSNLF
jgi:chloride channel, nucleotide-sensitive, 1A